MGVLDFLNALASCLCGPSTSQPQEPQKPEVYQLPARPSAQQQQQQQQQQAQPAPYYPAPQLSFPAQQQQPPEHAQKPHHKPQHHKPQQSHGGHEQGGGESYAHAATSASPPPHAPVPSPPRPHASSPPPQQQRPHGPGNGHVDPNLVNQSNPHYTALRAAANAAGDAMARAFEESHQAYARGDGARAKELSNLGKEKQREMERLNEEASEWIFRENNTDSKPGEVDLHGLYVKEAIKYTDQSIQQAKQRGDQEVHLIVGKGLHSPRGAAKLKPAIEELIQKHNLVATLDPNNAGVLIVQLNGQAEGQRERGGPLLDADEITRKMERGEDGCVIM